MSSDLSANEDLLFLTGVSYNEGRKEIWVEFSNQSSKVIERFKFFPFFRLPLTLDSSKLKELILSFGIKSFGISQKDSYYILSASSFSDLKKISNILGNCFGKLPLVINPERQFLLERGWTYFDSFMYFSDSLVKVESFQKDVSFAVLPEIPFNSALKLDEEQALFVAERAALSSILSIPFNSVPREAKDREELFLENIFFKNAEFVLWEKQESLSSFTSIPFGSFDKVSVMDFSPVWAALFSKSFFNIGPETKNCSCCKAFTLDDKNLLPSSMIEVVINEDNFFFESSSPSFSREFDLSHEGKSLRIEKKKEFFLKDLPIGPLKKGESILLPLLDAKNLLNEESVSLGKNHKVEWFCKNNESFFSKEISFFSNKLSSFLEVASKPQESLFDLSFEKIFAKYYSTNLSFLIAELPFQLMSSSSKFHSLSLARTIISVQEATLFKFREFSERNGYRVLHADRRSAFVKGYSSLALAKKFSSELSMPIVPTKGFSCGQRLRG